MGEQIEALARFVAGTGWVDLPGPVRQRAKLVLLDTLGVTLAGACRPETRAMRERMTASGGTGATLLAPGFATTDPRTAALLNAMAGRSIEMCEGQRGLQPAVHILPGVLAAGEHGHKSGAAMLEALVCGYEVAGRLNRGYTPRALSHPNGQVSLLGAAAAGARLQGLDGAGTSLAMRLATTMLMTPSYTNTGAGGTTLNLPAGMGAVAGVIAPDMALSGYAAKPDAIEEALGQMVGSGFVADHLDAGLGGSWEILDNYFRFYACCNPIHPALDSLQDALAELRPQPAEIARIEVATYAFASIMNNLEPPNYFASKYSLPHAAAVLILRGGLGFAELDDSSLADPAIAALRRRVHITEDPAMSRRVPEFKPARVTVTLNDGRQATAACDNSKRDMLRPDPEPQVRAKFHELAATVLTPEGIAAVEDAIERAEDWPSITVLTALLRQHGRDA